jgi:hypothetical protein
MAITSLTKRPPQGLINLLTAEQKLAAMSCKDDMDFGPDKYRIDTLPKKE